MTLAANGLPSPSTAWKEIPLAGEPALFKDFARDIVAYQKKDADKNGLLRGFHAKIHAGLMAEFQVLADLPAVTEIRMEANNRTWDRLTEDIFTEPRPPYGVLGLTLRRSG